MFLPSNQVKTREKFQTWEASVNLALQGLPRPLHTAAPCVLLAFHAILSIGRTPEYYISPFEGLLTHPPVTSLLSQLILACNKEISRRKNTPAHICFDVVSV